VRGIGLALQYSIAISRQILGGKNNQMAKRKKRKQRNLYETLKTELTKNVSLDGSEIVIQPSGETKMSEVLLEFIEPYSQYWKTTEELTKLLGVAAIAWNAALLPGSEWKEAIENAVKVAPPEIRQDMKAIVEEMMQRKETHFSHNKRMIMNYQVTMTKEGPHVTVLSTSL
jgi:hypothetical protein